MKEAHRLEENFIKMIIIGIMFIVLTLCSAFGVL